MKKISPEQGVVIRVAQLTNPKTKRPVYERVTRDGRLGKRAAAKLGVKRVKAWVEVQTNSWAEATKAVKAGRGKKVRAGNGHAKMAA